MALCPLLDPSMHKGKPMSFIGYRSYMTSIKELSGNDLLPTNSFLLFIRDCAFGNGRIDHFMDLLNDLLNRYYMCLQNMLKSWPKHKFLCKLIGCEAQEEAEKTIIGFKGLDEHVRSNMDVLRIEL